MPVQRWARWQAAGSVRHPVTRQLRFPKGADRPGPSRRLPVRPEQGVTLHGPPSSPALVTQFSCVSQGWACTTFHCDQVIWSFPPRCRFLIRTPPGGPAQGAKLSMMMGWT